MMMNRFSVVLLALTVLFSPVVVKAADLPNVITKAINDAASTGNPLVVEAVSDRLTTIFPDAKTDINNYVVAVAAPATQVAAVAKSVTAPALTDDKDDPFNLETAAGPENPNSLAADLNAMDVGAAK
jgi:hypothetical protein